jgi:hypothetical protein
MSRQAMKVELKEKEREDLEKIVNGHKSEQRKVLRASIIFYAAQGYTNTKIAEDLATNVDTVRLWRNRWVGLQGIDLETLSVSERLDDAPRSGAPSRITVEQKCQMSVVPSKSGRPISQWTGRENTRGIVEKISPRHAARLLKSLSRAIPLSSNG